MHASVQRCYPERLAVDERERACRALAAQLGKLSGFVVHFMLEEPGGNCVAVSIFDDQTSLAEANELIVNWFMGPAAPARIQLSAMACGEVIVQRGL